jgi:L-amino acid N-acyltransferase YncA
VLIRTATIEDGAALAAIYGPIVRDTAISFEMAPPSAAEMAARIERTLRTHPWLVAEAAGVIVGYAYASAHRERAAYRWSVDASVYVREGGRRRGVARALYTRLFEILAAQNFHIVHAGIALPNKPSIAFHEAMGFEPIGVYREVGYKLSQWRDVGWWARRLADPGNPPAEPIPFPALTAV